MKTAVPLSKSPVLLSLLLAGLLLVACGGEVVDEEPPLRPVRSQVVQASGGERIRVFSGSARAGTESRLSFRIAGMVEEVNVVVGETVRAGQILARIDPTDFQLQVQEAEAGLAAATAAWRNAVAEYERVRALYENNNASRSQLDAARSAAESGEAQMEVTGNRLELARSRLGYSTLQAPVTGSVAAVPVEVNENVQPGQMVVRLNYGSMPEVRVGVPEVAISEIERGDGVSVSFDALPGRSFRATVTEVGVASTETGTTFPVIARLEESDAAIRSGMAAEVAFRFGDAEAAQRIFVPPVSVVEDREGRFAFVVESRGDGAAVVRRRPVTVGELTSEGLEVKSGLTLGELVVTAGVRRLSDGMQVRLVETG